MMMLFSNAVASNYLLLHPNTKRIPCSLQNNRVDDHRLSVHQVNRVVVLHYIYALLFVSHQLFGGDLCIDPAWGGTRMDALMLGAAVAVDLVPIIMYIDKELCFVFWVKGANDATIIMQPFLCLRLVCLLWMACSLCFWNVYKLSPILGFAYLTKTNINKRS